MAQRSLRVFVSSTSEDLSLHRQAVREALVEYSHLPVMMQDFGAVPAGTVAACCDFVRSADAVIVLCAFRRGWVPGPEQGGDGQRSITGLEIEAARRHGLPVYIFLAHESWPGSLYEPDQVGREWVQRFRAELNQPAAIFYPGPVRHGRAEPEPTDQFRLDVRRTLLQHAARNPQPVQPPTGGAEVVREVLPLLADGARTASPAIPVGVLGVEYVRAAPVGWELITPASDPIELVTAYATDLSRAPRQSDGRVPLLGFVRAMAGLMATQSDALTRWAVRTADYLGEPNPPPPTQTAAPDIAVGGHLLVHVQPVATDPGRYAVKAWLVLGRRVTYLMAGEQTYSPDELPAVVDRLREEVAGHPVDLPNVWIEFFLPRALIAEAVDQWSVTLDFGIGENPVGAEHPVVVRAADRYTRAQPAWELRKRGTRLREDWATCVRLIDGLPVSQPARGLALRISRSDGGGVSLYNRLRDEPAVVCAVLSEPPGAPTASSAKTCALNTLLAAGVPVVAWSRGGPAAAAALAALLIDVPLAGLPDRFRQVRRQAVDSAADHPGRHLALLWDDPDRLPPDLDPKNRLRPPE